MSDDIRGLLLRELSELAPEADLDELDPQADIREELDIDSFDFVRFITAVSEALGRDIPEADYDKLFTLESARAYLAR